MASFSDDEGSFIYIPHVQAHHTRNADADFPSNREEAVAVERASEYTSRSKLAASSPPSAALSTLEIEPKTKKWVQYLQDSRDQQHDRTDRLVFSKMATYHICRICQRPRSDRFHREHPITPGTVPPPSGICRRCRISSPGQEVRRAKIVRVGESSPIKIGLSGIMPGSAVVSRKQMEAELYRKMHSNHRELASTRAETKEIIYRHIHPSGLLLNRAQAAVLSADNIEALNQQNQAETTVLPDKTVAALSELPGNKKDTASGPVEEIPKSTPIEYTESAIRRIARDEVERYRCAERRLDSHPDAYAHGRMFVAETDHRPRARPEATTLPLKNAIERVKHETDEKPVKYPYRANASHFAKHPALVSEHKARSESGESRRARLEAVYETEIASARARHTPKEHTKSWSNKPQSATSEADRSKLDNDHCSPQPEVEASTAKSGDRSTSTTRQVTAKKVSIAAGDAGRTLQGTHQRIDGARVTVETSRNRSRPFNTPSTKHGSTRADLSVGRNTASRHHSQAHSEQRDREEAMSDWTDHEYWQDGRAARTASRDSPSHQPRQQTSGSAAPVDEVEHPHNVGDDRRPEDVRLRDTSRRNGETHVDYRRKSAAHNAWDYRLHTVEPAQREVIDNVADLEPHSHRVTEGRHQEQRFRDDRGRSEAKVDSNVHRTGRPGSDMRRTSQVRFANTVDVSPTPPASDGFSASAGNTEGQKMPPRGREEKDLRDGRWRDCVRDRQSGSIRQARSALAADTELGHMPVQPRSESPARETYNLSRTLRQSPRGSHARRAELEGYSGLGHDPYGPYREELPSDSMMALTGSARSSAAPRGSCYE